jgi:uncharacterized protein YgiM (DUF1202 family)
MINTNRILPTLFLLLAVTLMTACGGADSSATLADVVEQVAQNGDEIAAAGAADTIDAAEATVSARSLRVRAEPSPTGEVIGGIKEGEVYDVTGLSSDGEWIQLAIPAIPGGEGWVSANFVSVQGAITGATITEAVPAAVPAASSTETGAAAAGGLPTATPRVAPQIPADPGTATVATDGLRLRVRAEPTADAEIVGYVYEGEVYEVAGATDDGLWTELRGRTGTDNVNGGWVATEFLVLN